MDKCRSSGGNLLDVAMAISCKASTRTSAFIPLVLCLALFACQFKSGLAKGFPRGGHHKLPAPARGRVPPRHPAPIPGALYLHFATSVIHEITTTLGIYYFRTLRSNIEAMGSITGLHLSQNNELVRRKYGLLAGRGIERSKLNKIETHLRGSGKKVENANSSLGCLSFRFG